MFETAGQEVFCAHAADGNRIGHHVYHPRHLASAMPYHHRWNVESEGFVQPADVADNHPLQGERLELGPTLF